MVRLHDITGWWKNHKEKDDLSGLAARFDELAAMRRYVPYLRELKFNKTSLQAGNARSAFKGRGMEFAEVRAYNYGDDVRDIDWRVTARKNQPFTKLYTEEKDREVYVWLDLSPKMMFGTRYELKAVTAAKTAALLGWFALANRDRFGMVIYDGQQTRIFQSKRTQENLLAILKKIEQIAKESLKNQHIIEDENKSLQKLHKKISRRAIIFAISSFDDFEQSYGKEIAKLAKNNEVFVVNIYDALEEKAPPQGEYLAQYGTQKQLLISKGKDFDKNYQAFFAQKRRIIRQFCAKFDCRYREVCSKQPIYKQLRPV